jgi:hypothetical protein
MDFSLTKAITASAFAALALVTMLPTSSRAAGDATLKAQDVRFSASIAFADAGLIDGKKAVSYRVVLTSKTCHSVIAGVAKFFSKTDDAGDDSSFLENGEVVKTNVFLDEGESGHTLLTVDVQSKHPRYANFVLTNASVSAASCVLAEGVGLDFY